MAKNKSVSCSDWHRGWGIGYTKIGKLSKGTDPDTYVWKGHNQGRHGQRWNTGTVITFKVNPPESEYMFEVIEHKKTSALPHGDDVIKAIQQLNQ